MNKTKAHLINGVIWSLIIGALAFFTFNDHGVSQKYSSLFAGIIESENAPSDQDEISREMKISAFSQELPEKFINKVPFVPQAPFANWDKLHDEACEEAAILTAQAYLAEEEAVSLDKAEAEIQALTKYEKENYGADVWDISAEQMVQLAKSFYGAKEDNFSLIEHYNLEFIKQELTHGNIFIIPAAGRVLKNPNFRQPGPLYHALVIIGYDDNKKQFITNDPGTRKGASFRYSYDNLLNSIHDFPGDKEKILEGRKVIIEVVK